MSAPASRHRGGRGADRDDDVEGGSVDGAEFRSSKAKQHASPQSKALQTVVVFLAMLLLWALFVRPPATAALTPGAPALVVGAPALVDAPGAVLHTALPGGPGVASESLEDEEAAAESEEDEVDVSQSEEDEIRSEEPVEVLDAEKPFGEFTPDELYDNAAEMEACPFIKVRGGLGQRQWWGLRAYLRMYRDHPVKACVPKLRRSVRLSMEDFTEHFRRWGRPLLFHFDSIRHLGFEMQARTLDELEALFPVDPSKPKIEYEANRIFKSDEEIDLGPAIASFKADGKLEKKQGGKRNFPRNMKIKASSMATLGVQPPPLIPGGTTHLQTPSLWMGTSTSGTAFHHDCCDNFVMMIHGTKRFSLASTTDWHALKPRCVGKMKSLCYSNLAEPTEDSYSHFTKVSVDVPAGYILYMPAGWFHHITNLGPTLMVNQWTKSKQTIGIMSCNKPS